MTIVLYESPHRLAQTVTVLAEICPKRPLTICRELTKRFETFIRGSVSEVQQIVTEEGVKGECVLVLSGAVKETQSDEERLAEAVEQVRRHMAAGLSHKQAVAKAVEQTGARKRDVYQETVSWGERD